MAGKGRPPTVPSPGSCRRVKGAWAMQTSSSASSGPEDRGEGCRVSREKPIETLGPHGLDIRVARRTEK